MGRKKGVAAKPRGRKSKISPHIFEFFTRHKVSYYAANEPPLVTREGENISWIVKQQTTRFFNALTNLTMHKYGVDVDIEAPLAEDPPDPDEKLGSESPKDPSWTEEESEAFHERWAALRRKIVNWFNHNCAKVGKHHQSDTVSKLLFRLTREASKPHKLSLLQYYQREYYHSRISRAFDERFRALTEEYEAARATAVSNNLDFTATAPQRVAVRTNVAKTCMDSEDEEFMEQLKIDWERDMQAEAEEYQTMLRRPATAEEYQASIDAIPTILQEFANAVTEMTGLATTILLGGPIPLKGGRLEVKSLHSGQSKGLVEQQWHKADRVGFKQVCDIFQTFVNSAYTLEDQRSRALPGTWVEPTTPSGSTEATPVARNAPLPASLSSNATAAADAQRTVAQPAASPALPPRTSSELPERTAPQPIPLRQSSITNDTSLPSSTAPSTRRSPEPAQSQTAHKGGQLEALNFAAQSLINVDSDGVPAVGALPTSPLTNESEGGSEPGCAEHQPQPSARRPPNADQTLSEDEDSSVPSKADAVKEWSAAVAALKEFPHKLRMEYLMLISTSPSWGLPWVSCVNSLVAIEQNSDPSKAKLSTVDRPGEFDQWFKKGRHSTFVKVSPFVFGRQFLLWWRGLQPESRVDESGTLVKCQVPAEEWAALRRTGQNGFFLVLLGLAWWRSSADSEADRVGWDGVVDDVFWVLQEWTRDQAALSEGSRTPSPAPSPPRSRQPTSSSSPSASSGVTQSSPAQPAQPVRRSKRNCQDAQPMAKRVRRR
ncbi:hypothetical protein EIP86_008921 [Pleurotus ostreatoroseus]|nr:hypothetical protein EIP86_008921 [Pleurotus ostreatoroseus]